MPRYANEEFVDAHFVYDFRNGNSLSALTEYQHRRIFETVPRCLRETNTLMSHAQDGRGRRNVWNGDDVLVVVRDNPSTSTRKISSATELSQSAE
jgi:hypothetical protein